MGIRSILRALGRGSAWSLIKQVAAVTLVVTAATTFAMFSPSYRYSQSEGFRQAPFDIWVSGPLDESTISQLEVIDPSASYAAVADVSPRYLQAGDRRVPIANGRLFDQATAIPLVYPTALRLNGARFEDLQPGEAILDGQSADALGVGVGSDIVANVVAADGSYVDIPVKVASIVVTTAHLKASLGAILSDDWRIAIAPDIPPFSSLFVATQNPTAFEEWIAASGRELFLFKRSDLLSEAVAQANQLVDRSRELAFLGLASMILVVFIVRDVRGLLRLRARPAAVLIAMGVRPMRIATAVVVEQGLLLGTAIFLGATAGATWFVLGFHLPVPLEDLGFVIATLLILAAAALGVVVLSVVRELSSIPVTRLLFEGA